MHRNAKSKPRLLAVLAPLALAGLLLLTLWAVALADLTGQEAAIYTKSNEDGLPDIAASQGGDYLALAWSRGRNQFSGPAGYVYLSVAPVTDTQWGLPVPVYPASDPDANAAREMRIAFDPRPAYSTTLHMVWNQKTDGAFNQIWYAACDVASGPCSAANVTPTAVVTTSSGPNQPDIAVDDGGRRHVVWVTTDGKVEYKCSTDGSSWPASNQRIVANPITATQPSIVHAEGRVHVVWTDGEWITGDSIRNSIGYRSVSVGSGCPLGTFDPPKQFWVEDENYAAKDPRIAAISDTVYVVWDVRTDLSALGGNVITYNLVYNWSPDNGASWDRAPGGPSSGHPQYLDIPNGTITLSPRPVFNYRGAYNYDYGEWLHPDVTLEISNSQVLAHVVWQESTVDWGSNDGSTNIFYTYHDGTSWQTPVATVTSAAASDDLLSVMPSVAVDKDGRTHIAYMKEKEAGQDNPDDWDIYYYGFLESPPQSGIYLPIVLKNSS